MSNFLQRIITGVLLVAIIGFAIMGGAYSFIALIGVLNMLAVAEFYRTQKGFLKFPRWAYGLLLSALVYTGIVFAAIFAISWKELLAVIPLVFVMFASELFLRRPDPFPAMAMLLFPIAWITIALILFTLTAFLVPGSNDYQPAIPLGIFILLWVHDSVAYAAGSLVGRKPLSPKISPHKTWEGSLAAAIVTIVAGNFISLFTGVLSSKDWVFIACCVIVFGTFGDLFKSLFKRNLGIKDMGNILPGHGGILDRFDSLIGSAPFIYCYLVLVYA